MTENIVIDATNTIAGRIASTAAKQALLGKTVSIINAEKAVITGSKENVIARYQHLRKETGQPMKGPYIPRMSDRFLRRMIRGMLPHKQARGREAFARIKCYLGVPDEFKNNKLLRIENAAGDKVWSLKQTTVQAVVRALGGKQ